MAGNSLSFWQSVSSEFRWVVRQCNLAPAKQDKLE
ncbi:hypothetical protein BVRB_3g065880 [Beta vulgaris subsp. vulgaris]|uniref:Uncharacterized protein n=1 Tax=Beta vulgaris subsp. vulgaris TaxID=3555 RepID=A0A0J8CS38_BETVV|nr:hypothetical protein BVRB_3g065880 [Beta vulgaris subsp. vulgaris]